MIETTTQKLRKMGRRRYLQALSGVGVSATTLQFITPEDLEELTDDPSKEHPYVAYVKKDLTPSGEVKHEPVYETIPHDEWEYNMAHQDAARRLSAKISEFSSSNFIRAHVEGVPGSAGELALTVQYIVWRHGEETQKPARTYEEVKRELPSSVRGVVGDSALEIRVDSVRKVQRELLDHATAGQHYDAKYRPVPGGCRIDPGDASQQPDYCTMGATAVDANLDGNWAWVTAGHCFSTGQFCHQPRQSNLVGEPYKTEWVPSEFDVALLAPRNNTGVHSYIAADTDESGDYRWPIYGIVTNDKLANETGNSCYQLYRQGTSSARDLGSISGFNSVSNCNATLTTTHNSRGGDSGGPIFDVRNVDGTDAAYIAGIVRSSGTESTPAENIEKCMNVDIV